MSSHPIIDSLKPSIMKFDLARIRRVMRSLGNPQNKFPSVHIAGTNGKGSVVAMTANALRLAGLRVGMYTSPHLEKVNERFQINGRMIADKDLDRLSRRFIRKFPHLTQFEFLTVIAFAWFAEQRVDVAVLETGLGGRLDATNIVTRVFACAITNIDYDHMNWLGNTLEKIAAEKAGIIKPRVPVVTGASGAALGVIKAKARRHRAPLVRAVSSGRLKLALQGEHQRKNAAVAVALLHQLQSHFRALTDRAIRDGVSSAHWPGRFEVFLLASRPTKQIVILDGAHNAAGCRILAAELKRRKLAPVHLLFGVLRDKEISRMTKILSVVTKCVVVAPVSSDRSADAATVAAIPAWKGRAKAATSTKDAWKYILSLSDRRPIVVAGSLYLVGEIRRRFL